MKMTKLIFSLALVLGFVLAGKDDIPDVVYEGMAWPTYDHDETTV